MKRLILLVSLCTWGCLLMANNPKAGKEATVTIDNARFTVLSPQLIRMEWSKDGMFEDCATLTVVNRQTETPEFKVKKTKDGVTIKTSEITLTYLNTGAFSADNLKVDFEIDGERKQWRYGMEPSDNLMGTTRTLDRADGERLKEPLELGILSRAGWAIIDDSSRHILVEDNSQWGEWVQSRKDAERQDLYIFAHGDNYRKALYDYQMIAGRAPMPPRYVFGYWWSRYWQYSDSELVDLIEKFKSINIPIDVLIVDMDWHETWGLERNNPAKDEYGQRIGWTGYTWQKELFPSPQNFLKWTEKEQLKVALNLHPASGIQPYESIYEPFTEEYGWKDIGKSVPFKIDDPKWADAYFKTIMKPMEEDGVDFWWLDWQQWKQSKFTKGLSNTFWLNYTFFNYAKREYPTQRPFTYHRWGGLGSHRYPLAFSGDTYATWATLAYLPYFTATSSNVNYGYWGHDIGGHMFYDDVEGTDPELYLRWIQYGVFTPIFKTHSTKDPRIVRYLWSFPDHMFMMRDAIRLRYSLVPYIYNAARENYDTGVGMCRPMYYDYPRHTQAYDYKEQFMFGDDILATAITQPADKKSGLAERKIWFPEGNKWYDHATGVMYEGGQTLNLQYTLSENPYYLKAGSIIPMNPDKIKNLQTPCDTLLLEFIPGADGSLLYYEDDGVSNDYVESSTRTRITKSIGDKSINVEIGARDGGFKGAATARSYELRFLATLPPAKVTVNGKEVQYSRFPTPNSWSYDAYTLSVVIYTDKLSVNENSAIYLQFDEPIDKYQEKIYGMSGIYKRCKDLAVEYKFEQGKIERYKMQPKEFLRITQAPSAIIENPSLAIEMVNNFDDDLSTLLNIVDAQRIIGEEFKARVRAVMHFEAHTNSEE